MPLATVPTDDNPTPHPIWTKDEIFSVQKTHFHSRGPVDTIARSGVKLTRLLFDIFSGYAFGKITPNKFLRRAVFLETVAGIPGMVAGALRHLLSLRSMRADGGWIHTLLEEAENERMHMLIYKNLYHPSFFVRCAIVLAQGIMWNIFFVSYMISPHLCHRFVGYLEEEAVSTYTTAINAMAKGGPLEELAKRPAPREAIAYWKLPADATVYDVTLAVRADEAHHRDVNHHFGSKCAEGAASLTRDAKPPQ